jgi:GxxExxY protein
MCGNEEIVRRAIGCIIRVHQALGSGFLENVYRRALVIELRRNRLSVETEKEVRIYYEGCEVGSHKLDMLVERRIIMELKTVDALGKV